MKLSPEMKRYKKDNPDVWASLDVLNACPYCEGALYILARCPAHGSSPINTYFWIQQQRNLPEWECSKCGEKGKNEWGGVPYTHFCPGTEPKPLDLSAYHTMSKYEAL